MSSGETIHQHGETVSPDVWAELRTPEDIERIKAEIAATITPELIEDRMQQVLDEIQRRGNPWSEANRLEVERRQTADELMASIQSRLEQ